MTGYTEEHEARALDRLLDDMAKLPEPQPAEPEPEEYERWSGMD